MGASVDSREPVRVERLRDGRVLSIAIDRPKGNVIDAVVMDALRAAVARAAALPELKLVILSGSGGNFSYGASVEEHRKDKAPSMLASFHATARELAAMPVPMAALVEGNCLGGGFELALMAQFLFATADASFGCPEVKLGVFPPVLAAVGALRLGAPLAERLVLTGATVGTDELLRVGALTGVVGPPALAAVLDWYDAHLAGLSAAALRHATRAARIGSGLRTALDATLVTLERLYLRDVLASHDGNEGIDAFLERRPPVWRDA